MPLEPDSAEFTHLATRWLDGAASPAEIERLFAALHESPACAQAFASMARFELLLEQTSREIDRESVVAAVVATKMVPHRRRLIMQRTLKVAAVLVLLGLVLWFMRPGTPSEIAEVKPTTPTQAKPRKPARVVLPLVASSSNGAPVVSALPNKPLPKVLDDFFLTGVSFDKLSLQDAVHAMEAQLRALNGGRRAELDRLRIMLPADAARREITFHAGAISFLKALRALAGLADCEVEVSDQNVMLASRHTPEGQRIESRTVETMLAKATADDRVDASTQLAELLADARALGMVTEDATGKVTGITGTRAQFDALAQMSESRAQVRALPPVPMLAFLSPTSPNQNDRVLPSEEAERQRAQAAATAAGVQRIAVRPMTDVIDPSSLSTIAATGSPDIVIVAQPAGEDQTHFTVFHPALVTPTMLANGDAREIATTLAPGVGVVLNGLSGQQGGSLQLGYSPAPSAAGFKHEAPNTSPSPQVAAVTKPSATSTGTNDAGNVSGPIGTLTGGVATNEAIAIVGLTATGMGALRLDSNASLTLINAASAANAVVAPVKPP